MCTTYTTAPPKCTYFKHRWEPWTILGVVLLHIILIGIGYIMHFNKVLKNKADPVPFSRPGSGEDLNMVKKKMYQD